MNAKKRRLGAGADIDTISSAFGADFPLKLGRVDVTQPDPAGRFPDPNTAAPAEIQVHYSQVTAALQNLKGSKQNFVYLHCVLGRSIDTTCKSYPLHEVFLRSDASA